MTKEVQKKSKHTSINTNKRNLSIQFSLDGFSFCISNSETNEIIHFSEYVFKNTLATPEVLLEKIEHIFSTDTELQHDFNEVEVIHQNNLATLVPTKYFNEEELTTYLNFNIKTLATDFITFDEVVQLDAKNVYVPYVNINNYVFQNFGEFEYKHHSTVLIDKLVENTKNTSEKHFFVHVTKNQIDIIVLQENKLLFYNNFPFNTKEDFIYYILFTAEQIGLNPDEFLLTFLGDIEEESEIYKITYNYIRNIDFIKSTNPFFKDEDDFSPHSNYILVN
ncbi:MULTISPECIES: DUF3822 family protein [Tenacibaculum]|uniref:DUF3822 family protein n=1 Tax=Tenacibaculum TaxID=104267 RepID=UPI001F0B57A9|nr:MULTISPECIES: DUF3822 family protein [Tenacibaculum]MCH3882621.1 DUF3822 family protein [Tenacibaculum aquimarinum]MDO6600668.1 DUF3822 family protein [Tenacibaculum sp. 1_MG-2023]